MYTVHCPAFLLFCTLFAQRFAVIRATKVWQLSHVLRTFLSFDLSHCVHRPRFLVPPLRLSFSSYRVLSANESEAFSSTSSGATMSVKDSVMMARSFVDKFGRDSLVWRCLHTRLLPSSVKSNLENIRGVTLIFYNFLFTFSSHSFNHSYTTFSPTTSSPTTSSSSTYNFTITYPSSAPTSNLYSMTSSSSTNNFSISYISSPSTSNLSSLTSYQSTYTFNITSTM